MSKTVLVRGVLAAGIVLGLVACTGGGEGEGSVPSVRPLVVVGGAATSLALAAVAPAPAPQEKAPKAAEEGSKDTAAPAEATAPPPLVVDKDAPLLLEEPDESEEEGAEASKNTPCYHCHANYEEEELSAIHLSGDDIGCVDCHGESLAHRNDENNTTPPDKMIESRRIDTFCRRCHQEHDVKADRVVVRWLKRGLKKTRAVEIVCTDCHGEHRLAHRTVLWDRKTGKLLPPPKKENQSEAEKKPAEEGAKAEEPEAKKASE